MTFIAFHPIAILNWRLDAWKNTHLFNCSHSSHLCWECYYSVLFLTSMLRNLSMLHIKNYSTIQNMSFEITAFRRLFCQVGHKCIYSFNFNTKCFFQNNLQQLPTGVHAQREYSAREKFVTLIKSTSKEIKKQAVDIYDRGVHHNHKHSPPKLFAAKKSVGEGRENLAKTHGVINFPVIVLSWLEWKLN